MALADDIEFYGRAVDAGNMTRAEAAIALTEASNGGLTVFGAGTVIDSWTTTRSRVAEHRATAARGLNSCYGLDE